jgi:hypothetical protein
MTVQQKQVDANLALVIELLAGFFGFLGIGWIYAGKTDEGVKRLILFLVGMVFAWIVTAVLIIFIIGICFIPVLLALQFGLPIWSALDLKKKLEQEQLVYASQYGMYQGLPAPSPNDAAIEHARQLYEAGNIVAAASILRGINDPRAQAILVRIEQSNNMQNPS